MRLRKLRRLIVAGVLLFLIGVVCYLAFAPIPMKPQAWTPPPIPELTEVLAENATMKERVTWLAPGLGLGPEDVAVKDGFAYTGVEYGRVLKISLDGKIEGVVADTGGRPLGMQHDAQGNLIIADAMKGLLSVAPDGKITLLTDRVDGRKMKFVDDLDIAADGVIWFSDASQRFGYGEYLLDFWEGHATGRLLTYNPTTRETKVVVEGLRFANGVAIALDQTYVLVTETFARRIRKHWLKGEKAGRTEILIDGLPGYPDNLSAAPQGLFWIALPAATHKIEGLHPKPFVRGVFFRLHRLGLLPDPPLRGWVIAINEQGEIVANLMDPNGESYHTVTSVNEFNGELFLGSIATDAIGRMPVPDIYKNHAIKRGESN